MELSFRYRFEAAHRFLKSESSPCMTPHGHSWYATLLLRFKTNELNDSQMTVEFSQVKKNWKILIQETFDHSYLHNSNDPIVAVLKAENFQARLLAFPGDPTTELISLFLFHKMEIMMKDSGYADRLQIQGIRVDETPTNSITCTRSFYLKEVEKYKNYQAWWTNKNPLDRSFHDL